MPDKPPHQKPQPTSQGGDARRKGAASSGDLLDEVLSEAKRLDAAQKARRAGRGKAPASGDAPRGKPASRGQRVAIICGFLAVLLVGYLVFYYARWNPQVLRFR